MSVPTIRYEARDGIALLTIDQPARMNAVTFEMWSSIPDLIARAEADKNVAVIALTGAGERAFGAGADISQFKEKRSDAEAVTAYDVAVAKAEHTLAETAKPTVAVIRGICFGGSLGLAMCCDLRIGASDARFRIPAARLGLGYRYADIARLVNRLGRGPVADLLLNAREVDAAEAHRLGILNAVFERDAFQAESERYLRRIAGNAPLTLRAVKRALVELGRPEAQRDVAAVDALVAACFASADYREGQAAFREKRDPKFTGE
jgi:enoyl-CoA hydratase/carnithine racemase